MRRHLGTLAVLLSLALSGCGGDTGAESSPTPEAEVTLVSATAGGGQVEAHATDVTDDADLAAYVAQFDDPFASKVVTAAGRLDGDRLLAQVVSIGCDVPPGAGVMGNVITPEKVPSPHLECFAPVTTVALAAVPG